MIKTGSGYADLGGDFFDRLEPERLTRYYGSRPVGDPFHCVLENVHDAGNNDERTHGSGLVTEGGTDALTKGETTQIIGFRIRICDGEGRTP